jgi:hypothetical protein
MAPLVIMRQARDCPVVVQLISKAKSSKRMLGGKTHDNAELRARGETTRSSVSLLEAPRNDTPVNKMGKD